MSNDVRNAIEVHDGGTLTTEDVVRAVYGGDADPVEVNGSYYKIILEDSGRIRFWTKYAPPVGEIANLAYRRHLHLTMEFYSVDNAECGSLRFFYSQDHAVQERPFETADFYPQEPGKKQ
jgi:hypothetical protein